MVATLNKELPSSTGALWAASAGALDICFRRALRALYEMHKHYSRDAYMFVAFWSARRCLYASMYILSKRSRLKFCLRLLSRLSGFPPYHLCASRVWQHSRPTWIGRIGSSHFSYRRCRARCHHC